MIVRRVDHLNIRVRDPRRLFSFLTEELRIPVAWPWIRMPGFESGGAALGLNLEPVRYSPGRKTRAPKDGGLYGLAFEPVESGRASAALAEREIPHSAPIPYIGTYPEDADTPTFHRREDLPRRGNLWTLVMLGGFLGDRRLARDYSRPVLRGGSPLARALGRIAGRMLGHRALGDRITAATVSPGPFLFLCEYHGFNVSESRRLAAEELARRDGGPLGLVRTTEILVGACRPDEERDRWRRLLDLRPNGGPDRGASATGRA